MENGCDSTAGAAVDGRAAALGGVFRFPILVLQTRNPPELPGIVGYERQVIGQSDSGDEEIVGADRRPYSSQISPNLGSADLRAIIKRKGKKSIEKVLLLVERLVNSMASQRSVTKLKFDDTAHADIILGSLIQPSKNRRCAAIKITNAGIGYPASISFK